MLSYRHAFHAGNHADVLKHATLSLLLASFRQKDKPFISLDTHAGGGLYDLRSDWAKKTGESAGGIARLWDTQKDWPELADYFQSIASHNNAGGLRYYPGSPDIARQLTRAQDKLTLLELHPQEAENLSINFGRDRRITLHHRDGFEGLAALLPPTPRRGLVLIDPPYERREDYTLVTQSLQKAIQRWATGTYVIWYPLLAKRRDGSRKLLQDLRKGDYKSLLVAELSVAEQHMDFGMHGSGLAIINAPWQLDTQLKTLLPRLCKALATDSQANWRVEWLLEGE